VCGVGVGVDLLSSHDRSTTVVLVAQTRQHTIKGVQGMQNVARRGSHSHVPNAHDGGAVVTDPRQGRQAVILAKMVQEDL
jgi:hypothetical protein